MGAVSPAVQSRSAKYDNMYDESIQRTLRRTRVQPIEFDAPYLPQLLENFQRPSPLSVILTGTAGDGKTYLCRRVWEHFGGDPDRWDGEDKIRYLPLPNGKTLIIIKDLSDGFRDNDCVILDKMAVAIVGGSTTAVFLLAANDGPLIEAWGPPDGDATGADDTFADRRVARHSATLRCQVPTALVQPQPGVSR